jgi:tetratricopeptide (TPR) repeat protein
VRGGIAEQHADRAARLLAIGDRDGAVAAYRAAAGVNPQSLFCRLAGARALIEDHRPAEQWLRRTLQLFPDSGAAAGMLGTELAEAGRFEEARIWFLRAVENDPAQMAYYYDLARSAAGPDPALAASIDRALLRPGLDSRRQVALHLARGQLCDLVGDAEGAVCAWREAAAIGNAITPYDRAIVQRHVDLSIATFTPAFAEAARELAASTALPLLVVGLPRSGTTLVEQILSKHPRVAAGGENDRLMLACRAVPMPPDRPALTDLAARLRTGWLRDLRATARAASRYVTDKLPQNYLWLGFVQALVPNARVIHCRRDPRDTAVSILGTFFGRSAGFPALPADIVFHVEQYRRLAAHWQSVLPPDRLHEISYEALAADPEPAIRALIDFLGLDWNAACLHPEANKAAIRTASKYQARRPIGAASVGRWQRYRQWLPELELLADS